MYYVQLSDMPKQNRLPYVFCLSLGAADFAMLVFKNRLRRMLHKSKEWKVNMTPTHPTPSPSLIKSIRTKDAIIFRITSKEPWTKDCTPWRMGRLYLNQHFQKHQPRPLHPVTRRLVQYFTLSFLPVPSLIIKYEIILDSISHWKI